MKTQLAKAASGPRNGELLVSVTSSSASNKLGGFTMKTIPRSVKKMVKILKRPHFSPRKILLKIATKTGVEKIITVLKERKLQKSLFVSNCLQQTCRPTACFEKHRRKISNQVIQQCNEEPKVSFSLLEKRFHFGKQRKRLRAAKLREICN